jgi:hypothetical protein
MNSGLRHWQRPYRRAADQLKKKARDDAGLLDQMWNRG